MITKKHPYRRQEDNRLLKHSERLYSIILALIFIAIYLYFKSS